MKSRIYVIMSIICILMTTNLYAENNESKSQEKSYHPVWPVLLGAGLITWGVYELGDDADEGERNVKILWGGAALASAGIVLYQWRRNNGKSKELSVKALGNTPVLALSYKY